MASNSSSIYSFDAEYAGPYCMYKILQERFIFSEYFLTRNLQWLPKKLLDQKKSAKKRAQSACTPFLGMLLIMYIYGCMYRFILYE